MRKNVLIGIAIGIFAGAVPFYFWSYHIRRSNVHVKISNQSGQTIDTLTLKHQNGVEILYHIYDQKETEIIFPNHNENDYRLTVTLHDGTQLKSHGMYVESGYVTSETILTDTIISEY